MSEIQDPMEREFLFDHQRYSAEGLVKHLGDQCGLAEWVQGAQWGDEFPSPNMEIVCVRPLPPLQTSDPTWALIQTVDQFGRRLAVADEAKAKDMAFQLCAALRSIAMESYRQPVDLPTLTQLISAQLT